MPTLSLLRWLGLGGAPTAAETTPAATTDTVRKIIHELDSLPAERARYLAAFAYLLGRVANADLDISAEETAAMERLLVDTGHLPEAQAVLAVQIAKSQNTLFGATENFLVARELKGITTPEQRREVLDCLFAVSAADESISSAEEAQIAQIARELDIPQSEMIDIRSAWSEHRDVIKALRARVDGD